MEKNVGTDALQQLLDDAAAPEGPGPFVEADDEFEAKARASCLGTSLAMLE